MDKNKDQEPHSVEECKERKDWPKWNDAIQAELNFLAKREVFGPITLIPNGVKPVGYKWVFVRKRNEKSQDIRHNWLPKDSPKDLELIMKKHTLP